MRMKIANSSFRFFISLLLLALAFGGASNLLAFEIKGDVWVLSELTTNQVLKVKLIEAEYCASNKNYAEAAEKLANVLDEYAADKFVFEGEPFSLILSGTILWYKAKNSAFKDQAIVDEAGKLLKQYKSKAEGKAWPSYKYLFHRQRDYYFVKKDYDNVLKIQKGLILYDVLDNWAIDSYLEYMGKFSLVDDTEAFFAEIEKKGGKINPKMRLLLISKAFENNDKDAWKKIFAWFDKNRQLDLESLKQGMAIVSSNLKSKDLEIAKEYYLTLTDLALGQVASEENMPKIAYILNERQKLVTLVPKAKEE